MTTPLRLVVAALATTLLGPQTLMADAYGNILAPSGPVSGAQMGQLRNYGRRIGQDALKDMLGLDLESLQVIWDPETWSFVSIGSLNARAKNRAMDAASSPVAAPSNDARLFRHVSFRLVQVGGFNISQGVRDLPYGVEVSSSLRPLQSLAALETCLSIPLSQDDTWRANVSLPVDLAEGDRLPWWWGCLGLGRAVALRSGFNSRLGFNQVETGMKTKWDPGFWGLWDLDYAWLVRYGQGSGETSNWLKFSKEF